MSPTGGHTENILLIVIVQLVVIITASRLFGGLFRQMGFTSEFAVRLQLAGARR
jgi:hypothetical protein